MTSTKFQVKLLAQLSPKLTYIGLAWRGAVCNPVVMNDMDCLKPQAHNSLGHA